MKKNSIVLGAVLSVLVACSPQLSLHHTAPQKNQQVGQDIPLKKEYVEAIAPYKKQLDETMNQKLSYTLVELNRRGDNPLLGQVLADFLLQGANEWANENDLESVDAAILNIGGIRNDLSKGHILVRNIFEVMPFENELVIIAMKGQDLKAIFDYYEKTQKNNPVAGLYIETQEGKLVNGLINGEKPQADKTYYIATSDYLAQGGDKMDFFAKGVMRKTTVTLRDLFLQKFKDHPEIKVIPEVRLKFNK